MKDTALKILHNIDRKKLNIFIIAYMLLLILFASNILMLSEVLLRLLIFFSLMMGLISLFSYMVQAPEDMNILPLKIIVLFNVFIFSIVSILLLIPQASAW